MFGRDPTVHLNLLQTSLLRQYSVLRSSKNMYQHVASNLELVRKKRDPKPSAGGKVKLVHIKNVKYILPAEIIW